MKLSLEIISNRMNSYSMSVNIRHSSRELVHLRLGSDLSNLSSDVLMVDRIDQGVQCICQEGEITFFDVSLEQIFNELIVTFQYYENWEKRVIQACHLENPWQAFVDLLEEVIQSPLYIVNRFGSVLAITEKYVNAPIVDEWLEIAKSRQLTFKTLKVLKLGDLGETPLIVDLNPPWVYYMQHALDQKHLYNLILFVVEWTHKLGVVDVQFAKAFQEIIAPYLPFASEQHCSLEDYFIQLLEGQSLSPEIREFCLAPLGWNMPGQTYHLLALQLLTTEPEHESLVLMGHFQKWFSDCVCFRWNHCVIILTEISRLEDIKRYLEQKLKHNTYHCGISLPFTDWNRLSVFWKQAQLAIGCALSEGCTFLSCEKDMEKIMFEAMSNLYQKLEILHPATETLKKYDEEHNTELLKTLVTYLSLERNTSSTARVLGIHRNSLNYRLNIIHDLCPDTWDSWLTRFHFLMSAQL